MTRILVWALGILAVFGPFLEPAAASARRRPHRRPQYVCPVATSPSVPAGSFSGARSGVVGHPFTVHYVACVQYPIMSGSTTIYYAIQYEVNDDTQVCTMLAPLSVSGSFPYPMACPNCIHVIGDTGSRPGYPGGIKTPEYDPTAMANDPAGIPRVAVARPDLNPDSISQQKIWFKGANDVPIYAVVHTIRIKARAICEFNGHDYCAKVPDDLDLQVGYEVVTPPESEKPSYTEYGAQLPEGHIYRVWPKVGFDPAKIALVILHQE